MIFVGICLVLLVLLQIRGGGDYSWEPSYEDISTDPLGSKLFNEWLRTQVDVSDRVNDGRLSETLQQVDTARTLVIITERFDPDAGSRKALLRYIREGGSVLIAAEELSDSLEEPFEASGRMSYQVDDMRDLSDTSRRFGNTALIPQKRFMQPRDAFQWTGETIGSYDDPSEYGPWEPLIIGTYGVMLAGRRSLGKGEVTLMKNPRIFTNYAMLYDGLSEFTEAHVQHFPKRPLVLDGYYKPRKSNRQGLLSTVNEYPALRFAYTTTLVAAIVFVVLGVRRRQRPIPIAEPPLNTSIEFAMTVAQMYEVGDTNNAIAERMADQVERVIRRRTGIRLGIDPAHTDHIAQALGQPKDEVEALLAELDSIRNGTWDNSTENFRAFHQRVLPIIDKGIS